MVVVKNNYIRKLADHRGISQIKLDGSEAAQYAQMLYLIGDESYRIYST